MEHEVRTLTRMVANPCYLPTVRRGLLSVRRFYPGLPIAVYRRVPQPRNFFALSSLSIDIPVLGLKNINRPTVTAALLKASVAPRTVSYTSTQTERFLVCSCKQMTWINLVRASDGVPLGSICAHCGKRNSLMQFFPESGRA